MLDDVIMYSVIKQKWCKYLMPDTYNFGLRMSPECRDRLLRYRFIRKPLVSDPSIHHGMCVTLVPWCMSESLTRGGGENVPGISGACATRNLTYLVRGPLLYHFVDWYKCSSRVFSVLIISNSVILLCSNIIFATVDRVSTLVLLIDHQCVGSQDHINVLETIHIGV